MMAAVPALTACAVLLWVPGAVVLLALRLPLRWAAVLAPALTAALVGAGVLLPLAWGLPAAAAALAGGLLLAAPLRGRRAAAQALPPGPRAPVLAAGAGVAVAAAVVGSAVVGGGARLGAVNQGWDAAWHANLTTWVLATGDAAPSAAGGLLGAGWREVGTAYPSGLHALAALVVRASGAAGAAATPVEALHAVVLAHAALVLPAAVAAVVREVGLRAGAGVGGPGAVAVGAGAAVGAVAAVLADVFPLGHLWRPAWPMTVGFALAVVTAAAALRCARAHQEGALPLRVALAVPAGCLAGTAAAHPSGAVAVGVGAGAWAVCWAAGPGARRGARAAAVGAVLALLLAGTWVASRRVPAVVSLFAHDYRSLASPWAATGRVLALDLPGAPAPAVDGGALQAGVAVAVLAALVVVVLAAEGARWLALLWLLLLAAAVDTVAPTAPGLRLVTGWFFSGQSRLVSLLAVVGAVLVGVAVTRAVPWLAGRRWTAVLAVVLGAAALAATAADTARRAAPHVALAYGDRVVGPDQQRVMRALAALPRPAGGRVLNDPVDGSPWLYATTGALPLFTHYDARRPDGAAALLLERLDAVDTDPAVRAALAQLRVCYVYRNDAVVSRRQRQAPGFAALDGAASLRLVARAGTASAYRVEPPVPGC